MSRLGQWAWVVAATMLAGLLAAPRLAISSCDVLECRAHRRAKLHCRDGNPACDLDATCDGVCTVALCRDLSASHDCAPCARLCQQPGFFIEYFLPVGKTRKEILYASSDAETRTRVTCRPGRRSQCPKRPACTLNLSGFVTETSGCRVRALDYGDGFFSFFPGDGWGFVDLTRVAPGVYRLDDGISNYNIGFTRQGIDFSAARAYPGERGHLEIEFAEFETSTTAFHNVHGTLTATLVGGGTSIDVRMEF